VTVADPEIVGKGWQRSVGRAPVDSSPQKLNSFAYLMVNFVTLHANVANMQKSQLAWQLPHLQMHNNFCDIYNKLLIEFDTNVINKCEYIDRLVKNSQMQHYD